MRGQSDTLSLLTGLFIFLMGLLVGNEISRFAILHDLSHNGRLSLQHEQTWICAPDFPPTIQ
jgi:hypothetical protein